MRSWWISLTQVLLLILLLPSLSGCFWDGNDGVVGNDGLNSLMDINPESVGVNCFNGGLRVDAGIDANGNNLLDPDEINETSFICNGGDHGLVGWQMPELIEADNSSSAAYPQVAVAKSGNAMATWIQWDGVRNNVWVNRFTPAAGWGSAELIGPNLGSAPGAGASQPSIAMNANGDAVVVWRHSDGVRADVWANRYVAGSGWGGAGLIETNDSGSVATPQVALDDGGNAIAIWNQWDGSRDNIWANHYAAGVGWGTAAAVEMDDAGGTWWPQVVVVGSGNFMAVWGQSDGVRGNGWSSHYVAGTGWGTPELIAADGSDSVGRVRVALDESGNAMAVWDQWDGVRNNLWANRYVPGSGWGSAELIEADDAGGASMAQVAVDGSGNAVALWSQSDGVRSNIWANRYLVGAGWGAAELVEINNAGDAVMPQLVLDAHGNGIAVWYQYDGYRYNIWANRFVAGWGWGAASVIETDNAGDATAPQLAIDGNGNVMTVWYQDDGAHLNIWANRYLAPVP